MPFTCCSSCRATDDELLKKSEEFKSKNNEKYSKNPKLFRDFQNTQQDHLGPKTINNTSIHLITKVITWKNGTTKIKSEIKLK